MIYLHYETFNVSAKAAEAMGLDSTQMVKLKFASNKNTVKLQTGDFNRVKTVYLPMLKQIPTGKRKYDPIDHVWTIPASAFDVIRQLVEHEMNKYSLGLPYGTVNVIKHKDLYKDYIFAQNQPQKQKSWQEEARERSSFEAEATEDFFHQSVIVHELSATDIQRQLKLLIAPHINFELNGREDFMRGYKIAARRYHPDLNKDDAQAAAKMSELNSLWMQYKEIA